MKLAASASLAVLSFLIAGQAAAQAADSQTQPPTTSENTHPVTAGTTAAAPAETTAAGEDTGALSDIVVTATRRETNLQSTPISISVLNTQALADRHVQSLFNLADGSVPSLRVATFEARQSALTIGIRGIVPYDQNQTARDGGVSVYVDGVALGKTQGLNAALFDIERIEVLKGPQGTLFGRNTEGGALSLVTRAPSGEFEGRLLGGVGNYGERNAELHLDLPTYYGVALKFDGVYQHQDPTVKDPLSGSTGWNFYDRKGGRVAARIKPIDGLTADFAYDYAKDENTPMFSQLLNYNPNGYPVGTYTNPNTNVVGTQLYLTSTGTVATPCGGTFASGTFVVNSNGVPVTRSACIAPKGPLVQVRSDRQDVAAIGVPQQPSVDITHGFSANIRYKLSPAIELRSITAWRGVSTDQWDNSGGPNRVTFVPNGTFSRYSLSYLDQHQFSQELQAVGHVDQFDYVVGGYYFTENAREYAATPQSNQWNADGTAFVIRTPNPAGVITSANSGYQQRDQQCNNTLQTTVPQFTNSCQFITRASEAYDHNYSAFGNLTFTPAGLDILHFTAGARYTKDKRRGQLYVVNNRSDLNPINAVPNSVRTPFFFNNSISRVDPLFNVLFDATPDIHLYAKYATGFRAGGANDRSQSFNQFGPETLKSYEVGAKMDFFDHRARLNLAGYIMDRKNTQFDFDFFDTNGSSPTNGAHIEQTLNAGDTKIRGVEADLTVKPTRELTLSGSYAYTHVRAPRASYTIVNGTTTVASPLQQLYIVYTPENAASGAIDYVLPTAFNDATIRFHLDGNYASSQYSFQLEPTKTDASFVVNGRISLADIVVGDSNKVTLAVWARNLFDTTYIYRRSAANSSPVVNNTGVAATSTTAYGGILGDYGNLNTPRTWGVELSAKF